MSIAAGIHWHEGLFLQSHHLQRMQHFVIDQMGRHRRLSWDYPYGLLDARLSADDLTNGYVRFERLHAVMPSGLEIRVPENADLPVLPIKKALNASSGPLTVSLGVPLWSSSRGNTIESLSEDDWRVKRLYRVHETDCFDENTGENPQVVRIRRINARLVLPGQDPSDLEVFPLIRITAGTGEQSGMPREDVEYIPPCLCLSGSPYLRELVAGIGSAVEANSKELSRQLANERAAGLEDEIEPLLRLHTLNRYGARLAPLVKTDSVSPFELYLELRELYAELCCLRLDADPYDVPDYDHDNPAVCFQVLSRRIRRLVKRTTKQRFLTVDFQRKGGVFLAELEEEHFTRPSEYFLAVKSRKDPRDLVQLVEAGDKFKLMAPSRSRGRAILGVGLVVEHAPPASFPRQTGITYFRLQRSEKDLMWQAITNEKKMVVVGMEQEVADFEMTLYMAIPEFEENG